MLPGRPINAAQILSWSVPRDDQRPCPPRVCEGQGPITCPFHSRKGCHRDGCSEGGDRRGRRPHQLGRYVSQVCRPQTAGHGRRGLSVHTMGRGCGATESPAVLTALSRWPPVSSLAPTSEQQGWERFLFLCIAFWKAVSREENNMHPGDLGCMSPGQGVSQKLQKQRRPALGNRSPFHGCIALI